MLQANAISPETKLAEYGQQIKRLMQRNPGMTQGELACLIRKQPRFVGRCLEMTHLLKNIQVMVDRGEISVENAYMLAKIPRSMQMDYVDRAIVMPRSEFKPFRGTPRSSVVSSPQIFVRRTPSKGRISLFSGTTAICIGSW